MYVYVWIQSSWYTNCERKFPIFYAVIFILHMYMVVKFKADYLHIHVCVREHVYVSALVGNPYFTESSGKKHRQLFPFNFFFPLFYTPTKKTLQEFQLHNGGNNQWLGLYFRNFLLMTARHLAYIKKEKSIRNCRLLLTMSDSKIVWLFASKPNECERKKSLHDDFDDVHWSDYRCAAHAKALVFSAANEHVMRLWVEWKSFCVCVFFPRAFIFSYILSIVYVIYMYI